MEREDLKTLGLQWGKLKAAHYYLCSYAKEDNVGTMAVSVITKALEEYCRSVEVLAKPRPKPVNVHTPENVLIAGKERINKVLGSIRCGVFEKSE